MRSPSLTYNRAKDRNLGIFRTLLTKDGNRKRLLVVGAGSAGALFRDPLVEWTLTDLVDGPSIDVVCDALALPFEDGTYDGVIVVAVLEHVPDPELAVREIHRVLKPEGLVYSEIPFLQHVHAGAWDFTRYTAVGHRRLFRMFDSIEAERLVAGPASSLAWALEGFVVAALGHTPLLWRLAHHGSRYLFCWLPPLDRFLHGRAALDSACGTAFLGRRRDSTVDDLMILSGYSGAGQTPVEGIERHHD